MPQGETFWNPYRFVPARPDINRTAPYTDERFQGLSGTIECTLTNLSLLFIGGNRLMRQHFLTKNGSPFIPGSSIKGMLRSLVETVGGGCLGPFGPNKCRDPHSLCVACRMFGMLDHGNVHKGQVCIGDGELRDETPAFKTVSIIQGQPKMSHWSFYVHPLAGGGNMVKMYFHQPKRTTLVLPIPANLKDRAVLKDMLEPGHSFSFTLQFERLRAEELNLLLYVLKLEEHVEVSLATDNITLRGPMRHKIGNAKGQGPGSCHIQIGKLALLPEPGERFTSLKPRRLHVFEGPELKDEITRRTALFAQDDSPTMTSLRKMMVWDESDTREFGYPSYDWFRKSGNSSVELKPI